MKRGDVWWVRFDTSAGGEIRKKRPAIIVSNDISNKFLNRVQVVPLTSNVKRVFPSEALITLRGRKHKAMANQLATVAKARVRSRMDRISRQDLQAVELAIKVQLQLP